MRKQDITDLTHLLADNMVRIADSPVENRAELLRKSIGEFETTLIERIEPLLPDLPDEPLAKGINHIAMFANATRDMVRTIDCIQTGKPGWMMDSSVAPEEVSEETKEQLERVKDACYLTLRLMVNDTAELPADDDEMDKAAKAGQLYKIETFAGDEVLVKSAVPPALGEYFGDPVYVMMDAAVLGRDYTNLAKGLAAPLVEAEAIDRELAAEYPEVFDLGKAAGDNAMVGSGGDGYDDPEDPGDEAGEQDDTGAPQNPLEMIVRLGSAIVVIGGSMLQAADPDANPNMDLPDGGTSDVSGLPDDSTLQRRAPGFGDVTLEKIYNGEVEVDNSVADALEERDRLRAERDALTKRDQTAQQALAKLQETVDRLTKQVQTMGAQPAQPKGAVFQVTKSADATPNAPDSQAEIARIENLAKTNPDAAARELLKKVHQGGGAPVLPPGAA